MKLDDEDELTPEEQAELDRLMSKMTPERLGHYPAEPPCQGNKEK